MGDVGDLAGLAQAHAGVRDIDDVQARLGHELSDCLWSIPVLADRCGTDLEAEFIGNTRGRVGHVCAELEKQPTPVQRRRLPRTEAIGHDGRPRGRRRPWSGIAPVAGGIGDTACGAWATGCGPVPTPGWLRRS